MTYYTYQGDRTTQTEVVIPDSYTNIADFAFHDYANISNVIIPNSVVGIGNFAFKGCSGLTNVIIPNSVTHIGSEAFGDCSRLPTVVIPDSVTIIGFYAFANCTNLTTITLIAKYIDELITVPFANNFYRNCFNNCPLLTTVIIRSGDNMYRFIKNDDYISIITGYNISFLNQSSTYDLIRRIFQVDFPIIDISEIILDTMTEEMRVDRDAVRGVLDIIPTESLVQRPVSDGFFNYGIMSKTIKRKSQKLKSKRQKSKRQKRKSKRRKSQKLKSKV
jgi:hypothetical protein